MPSLIAKHQEKQTVVKLKRMYSILSQAFTMNLRDNEPVMYTFNEEGAVGVYNIFKPHLKIARDCGLERGNGCIYTGQYGNKSDSSSFKRAIYATDKRYYKVLLNDGSSIVFRGGANSELYNIDFDIFYDINGDKGPNKWGHDMFEFFGKGRQLIPSGIPNNYFTYNFDSACAPADSSGDTCSAWVIYKGNMDYLHCDDLSWNGKQKCK